MMVSNFGISFSRGQFSSAMLFRGCIWNPFYNRGQKSYPQVSKPKHVLVSLVAFRHQLVIYGHTWRIIPASKWLITMVSKSPKHRVVPLPNGHSW